MVPWWAPWAFGLLFLVGLSGSHGAGYHKYQRQPSNECIAAYLNHQAGGHLDVSLWCK